MNKVLLFFISGVIFISAIFLFTNMEMDDLHGDLKDGWEEKNKMKKTIGVGAIAPLDSEILFDGSIHRYKKRTY